MGVGVCVSCKKRHIWLTLLFQRKSVSSSDKEEGRVSPAASQRNTSESEKPKDEATEYDKERMRMYRLRHKLQKLVYQKKPVSTRISSDR